MRKFLPLTSMPTSDVDYESLFNSGRLCPWIPEHKQRIDSYCAMHGDSKFGKDQRALYDKRLKDFESTGVGPAEEYGDGSGGKPEKGPEGRGFPGEEIEGKIVPDDVVPEEGEAAEEVVVEAEEPVVEVEKPKKKRGRPKKSSSPQ